MRVVIESPYKGDIAANEMYARQCMLDSLSRGEAPFLGHLLYTQVLDDSDPEQRTAGIDAHLSWIVVCDAVVVYTNRGISDGMVAAIQYAGEIRKQVLFRRIDSDPEALNVD